MYVIESYIEEVRKVKYQDKELSSFKNRLIVNTKSIKDNLMLASCPIFDEIQHIIDNTFVKNTCIKIYKIRDVSPDIISYPGLVSPKYVQSYRLNPFKVYGFYIKRINELIDSSKLLQIKIKNHKVELSNYGNLEFHIWVTTGLYSVLTKDELVAYILYEILKWKELERYIQYIRMNRLELYCVIPYIESIVELFRNYYSRDIVRQVDKLIKELGYGLVFASALDKLGNKQLIGVGKFAKFFTGLGIFLNKFSYIVEKIPIFRTGPTDNILVRIRNLTGKTVDKALTDIDKAQADLEKSDKLIKDKIEELKKQGKIKDYKEDMF